LHGQIIKKKNGEEKRKKKVAAKKGKSVGAALEKDASAIGLATKKERKQRRLAGTKKEGGRQPFVTREEKESVRRGSWEARNYTTFPNEKDQQGGSGKNIRVKKRIRRKNEPKRGFVISRAVTQKYVRSGRSAGLEKKKTRGEREERRRSWS